MSKKFKLLVYWRNTCSLNETSSRATRFLCNIFRLVSSYYKSILPYTQNRSIQKKKKRYRPGRYLILRVQPYNKSPAQKVSFQIWAVNCTERRHFDATNVKPAVYVSHRIHTSDSYTNNKSWFWEYKQGPGKAEKQLRWSNERQLCFVLLWRRGEKKAKEVVGEKEMEIEEEEELRRRKLEEALEVKSLRRIISAYLKYV